MSPLNDNQIGRVLVTFSHVDGLLSEVDRLTRAGRESLRAERADFAPDEARLMQSAIVLTHGRILEALDRLGITRPQSTTSARWSARTSLTYADIALSDITTANLRGYGDVDAAAASELLALVADLRTIIGRARALLVEHEPGGLRERVAAVPGIAGEVLQGVERFSAEHGLAEVRSLLAAAAERATGLTFDVGIFGRVSAGKSSLINALIGEPVLPVGSTPVTAVPIRIAHGDSAATVFGLDGTLRTIAIDEIAEYASETNNPANRKGVRSIDVAAPGVPPGLRLLDTPGVGSLGTSGPAQAFAWLPRCDLGLVLIAAGTAVGRDDLALISGLAHAGIACRVLLSKVDTISPEERKIAEVYLQRELTTTFGPAHGMEIQAVSALRGSASISELRTNTLAALAADHLQASTAALRSRLHRLVAVAAGAFGGVRAAPPDLEAYKARAAAADVVRQLTDRLGDQAGPWLDDAATATAAAWSLGEDGRAAARASLFNSAAGALATVREAVDGAFHDKTGRDVAARRIPPLFDPELLDALPALSPPRIVRTLIGRHVARGYLESVEQPLREALSRYGGRLYSWGIGHLEEWAELDRSTTAGSSLPEHRALARLAEMIDAMP